MIRRTSPAHTRYQVEIRTWDLPCRRQAGAINLAIRLIPLSYALLDRKSKFVMLVFIKLESGTLFWILDKKRTKISLTIKVMFSWQRK